MDLFTDYDYETKYYCSQNTKSRHCTRLMYLIIKGINLDIIQDYLLKNREEIDAVNEKGWTALMIACYNNIQIVKLLLLTGADVNIQVNDGWTALIIASYYAGTDGNVETVRLLLERGADVNKYNHFGMNSLICAVKHAGSKSNVETVRLLLEKGADFNSFDQSDRTPLMYAIEYVGSKSNMETVQLLLQHGACIQEEFPECIMGHEQRYEIISLLLKYGLDPDRIKYNDLIFSEYVENMYREINGYWKILKLPTKSDFSKIFPELLSKVQDLLYRPGSLRYRLLECQWHLDNYPEMTEKHTKLIDYLAIQDAHFFRFKVMDQITHMH